MKSVRSAGAESVMQEELKAVLQRRRQLDIKKTPDIFIQKTSTPDEVWRWLEAKGFVASAGGAGGAGGAARALRLAGHALFALPRARLEALLGRDEGRRLYSQLLVQRNVSGYKTTSASELQSILRKVREKVEVS